jgi:predicted nuclease with TOPRIM domain
MAEEQARAASPAPERRSGGGGRGFIAGLLGGVLGAGGAIYALQIPEVRENLPLPPQAELVVNPAAVARISALEEELARLRGAVREAEESASVESLRARLDQLSDEVTTAATTAQLAELRAGLSDLAEPAGAATLEERLRELEAGLGARIDSVGEELAALEEAAARRSTLAALEAAVDGFASRLGTLEEDRTALREAVSGLETLSADLDARTSELAERVAADETALVERAAALAGRIDALARDVSGFREALGAAEARFVQLREATAEELTAMRAAIGDVAARTDAVESDTAALEEALAATEATVADFTERMTAEADAFETELASEIEAFVAELEDRVAAIEAAVAEAGERSEVAAATAEETRVDVATVLARTRTAAGVTAAASQLDAALATGDPLAPAATTLGALATDPLDAEERRTLEAVRELVGAHTDGVPTATALQRRLDELRPELIAAVAPADGGGGGVAGTLMDRFNLRARGVSAEVANALDAMATALARGDVEGVVARAEQLPTAARDVLAGWLEAARAHAAVADARDELLALGRALAAAAGES